jgi:hypothetical protein
MDHTQVHAVVELVDKGGKVVDTVDRDVKMAKLIAASQAFRKYSWLRNAPIQNASDNLRGMVVNAKARMVYDFTVKYGTKIEKFNTFVTIAVALSDSSEQIYKILRSRDSWLTKTAQLGTQATAVAMNVLTGIVTVPAHAVLSSMSMEGYCEIPDILRGQPLGTCGQTLKAIDASVESTAKQVRDGNNIYIFVNTTINPRVSRALGL